jgi:hypothetical protein
MSNQLQTSICECSGWGRDNRDSVLMLSHHPNCGKYKPEAECRELMLNLINGIESWAADEDGIHPACWEAYRNACFACGEWERLAKAESQ